MEKKEMRKKKNVTLFGQIVGKDGVLGDGDKLMPGALQMDDKSIPVFFHKLDSKQVIGHAIPEIKEDGLYFKITFSEGIDGQKLIEQMEQFIINPNNFSIESTRAYLTLLPKENEKHD
jgi:hypothetical protein